MEKKKKSQDEILDGKIKECMMRENFLFLSTYISDEEKKNFFKQNMFFVPFCFILLYISIFCGWKNCFFLFFVGWFEENEF